MARHYIIIIHFKIEHMKQCCKFTFHSFYFAKFQTIAKFKEQYNDHIFA